MPNDNEIANALARTGRSMERIGQLFSKLHQTSKEIAGRDEPPIIGLTVGDLRDDGEAFDVSLGGLRWTFCLGEPSNPPRSRKLNAFREVETVPGRKEFKHISTLTIDDADGIEVPSEQGSIRLSPDRPIDALKALTRTIYQDLYRHGT